MTEVEKHIDFYIENIGSHNHAILYFNLGVLNFGMNKFSKALFWFNKIINEAHKYKRSVTVMHLSRLLRLLVFLELGHFDIMENQLRSTIRYIAKKGPHLAFDQALLKYIRKIASCNSSSELTSLYKELLTTLLKISKDPAETKTQELFDFISWVESKVKGKPFAEIAYRKHNP